jgi:glutathione S-transferase
MARRCSIPGVISEALDRLYPEPNSIPASDQGRTLVRRWEALADGIRDVLVPVVLDGGRAPEQQDRDHSGKLEGKVRAALDYLEPFVKGRETVGPQFSLASSRS